MQEENNVAVTTDTRLLAEKIASAVARLDKGGQQLGLTLIRLLAQGEPVSPARLAERVGWTEARVFQELHRWPGVYWDDTGRVIGYAGLTVVDMGTHRLHMDGREL